MTQNSIIYAMYSTMPWSTIQNKQGSPIIYTMYFTMVWLMRHGTNKGSPMYNLCCLLCHDMVNDTKQISPVIIYAAYYAIAWSTIVSFPLISVVVCTWSMTRNLFN